MSNSDWPIQHSDQYTYTKCPYGEVSCNYELRKLEDHLDGTDDDYLAVKQIGSMTPADGSSVCSSQWENQWLECNQDWSPASGGDLHDWDPTSGTGSLTVSLSANDVGISWNTNASGDISHTKSGDSSNFEIHGLWFNDRHVTQTIKPGTVALVNDCHDGKVVEIDTKGHFQHELDLSKHWLRASWDLYHYDGC